MFKPSKYTIELVKDYAPISAVATALLESWTIGNSWQSGTAMQASEPFYSSSKDQLADFAVEESSGSGVHFWGADDELEPIPEAPYLEAFYCAAEAGDSADSDSDDGSDSDGDDDEDPFALYLCTEVHQAHALPREEVVTPSVAAAARCEPVAEFDFRHDLLTPRNHLTSPATQQQCSSSDPLPSSSSSGGRKYGSSVLAERRRQWLTWKEAERAKQQQEQQKQQAQQKQQPAKPQTKPAVSRRPPLPPPTQKPVTAKPAARSRIAQLGAAAATSAAEAKGVMARHRRVF